jgi:hypothetical protein
MLRILLMVLAAIVVVMVAIAIIHALFWLLLVGVVILAVGMMAGFFRLGRASARPKRR